MSLPAATLRAMLDAGCTAEQIVAVAESAERDVVERDAERREKDRVRKREERARKKANKNNDSVRDVTRTSADIPDTSFPDKKGSHTLQKTNPISIPPSPPKGGSSPADEAFSVFCETAADLGLPVPRILTADRRRKLDARLKEHGIDGWREGCRRLRESDFCRGHNDRGWLADLDFMLQPKSLNRLVEGGYEARHGHDPPTRSETDLQRISREMKERRNGPGADYRGNVEAFPRLSGQR